MGLVCPYRLTLQVHRTATSVIRGCLLGASSMKRPGSTSIGHATTMTQRGDFCNATRSAFGAIRLTWATAMRTLATIRQDGQTLQASTQLHQEVMGARVVRSATKRSAGVMNIRARIMVILSPETRRLRKARLRRRACRFLFP